MKPPSTAMERQALSILLFQGDLADRSTSKCPRLDALRGDLAAPTVAGGLRPEPLRVSAKGAHRLSQGGGADA